MTHKKKIGIITTHHFPNYGNKLQNYALESILRRMGYIVETINDARSWNNMNSYLSNWKSLVHYITRYRLRNNHIKTLKFIKWSKKNIKYSRRVIRRDSDADNLSMYYDYFIVGSDQIWNPEWSMFSNSFGFATFAKKEQKIAYAPSLGVSKMIPKRIEEYKQLLCNWKALSCRELEGANIIKELSGQNVEIVLDPTLLLTSEDWEKVTSSNRIIKEDYALLYHLRELDDSVLMKINAKAKEMGLILYTIKANGINDIYGPHEFLNLVKNSTIFFTDSFHGSVFALQFHRPLCVLHLNDIWKDKISRIKTLFEHANIPHNNFHMILNYFIKINWDLVDISLAQKREESLNYLINNLD